VTRRSTRRLSTVDARRHLAQAEEFLDAARADLDAERFNAAAGNAAVAIINSADAVAGLRLGERWIGAHELAGRHVAKAGKEGRQLERALQRAIPHKNKAQYDPGSVTPARAADLVKIAGRAVATARRVDATSAAE